MSAKKDAIAKRLLRDAEHMEDPVAVERAELARIQDGLGEICMHFSYVRRQWGDDDPLSQIGEALIEINGILHFAQGKCFLPDPKRDEAESDESEAAE